MRYRINLESVGNPDFNQNPNKPISPETYTVSGTFLNASLACRKYITYYELGGGNWVGGQVYDGLNDDKQVAYVSYNGRVWDMNGKEIKI